MNATDYDHQPRWTRNQRIAALVVATLLIVGGGTISALTRDWVIAAAFFLPIAVAVPLALWKMHVEGRSGN